MLQLIIRVLSLTLALLLVLKPLISVAANQEAPKAVQTQSSAETAAQKNPSAADQSTGTESPEDTRWRELTAKYGAEIAEAILAGTVVSGMTMEQVLLVGGAPTRKEVIPPDMELWHYPASEVAFQNGKVSYIARNPEPQPTPQPSSKETIYFDDFSSYTPGFPPTGWLLRGADQVTPTVQEVGGIGPSYRLVDLPEVPWQYWDRWLLKDGLAPDAPYAVTVKLNFQQKVADRAGLTIAWNDANWNRIDIQPNVYGDDIEFRETYKGPIQSNPVVNNVGHIPISAFTDYWLRVVVTDDKPGQGRLSVLWSTDGTHFRQVINATGLQDLRGLIGVSTAGPHLPHVYFDDFSVSASKQAKEQVQKEETKKENSQGADNDTSKVLALSEQLFQVIKNKSEKVSTPEKVDKKTARAANAQGLTYLQNGQIQEAISAFRKAYQADQSDAEILNNLGYAYLLSNNLDGAALFTTMSLIRKPERSSAWANIGQALAKNGKIPQAIASFVNAYRFSRDLNKTDSYFLGLMEKETDANVKQALQQAIQIGEKTFINRDNKFPSAK